jgi:pimeloyl-ACP methyl ester carboxylesterase
MTIWVCGLLSFATVSAGCGGVRKVRAGDPLPEGIAIVFVHGAGGDGFWYRDVEPSVRAHESAKASIATEPTNDIHTVYRFKWGMAGPMFVMNFNDRKVHDRAEDRLARLLIDTLRHVPNRRIDLIAHSAGSGVVLGALQRLPEGMAVRDVMLLQPSVSPGYDIAPALERVGGRLLYTHSTGDVMFLKWRCSTFGTYDGVRTSAAGHGGFDANMVARLPESSIKKLVAIELSGDHFAPLDREVLSRLLARLRPD